VLFEPMRLKNKYFLDPRQFALISCLHIILDSSVNPIRFTVRFLRVQTTVIRLNSPTILFWDLTASELQIVLILAARQTQKAL
jgi:hypothetical protein